MRATLHIFFVAILIQVAIIPIGCTQDKKGQAIQTVDYLAAIDHAYQKVKGLKEGKYADYIKEQARVDPNIYGIAIVTTDGKVYTHGDLRSMVFIQSISKV